MYWIFGAQRSDNKVIDYYHVNYDGVVYFLETECEFAEVPDCINVWCVPGTSKRSIEAGRWHYEIVKVPVCEGL